MTLQTMNKEAKVLLVEDNLADVALIQEALHEIGASVDLSVTEDGAESLDFLYRKGEYAQAPRPDIILLDLNLPKKSGYEVLEDVKKHQELRRIPVIILTTSEAETDVARAYAMGANCYITKPPDLDSFFTMVKSIYDFWLNLVELPSNSNPDHPFH